MSAMIAPPAPADLQRGFSARIAKPRPGFIRTTARILWVLTLTMSALVGGVVYQARSQCPHPCWIDGLTPIEALRGAPKPFPAR